MGVKDTANLALIPAAYKASKVYSALPTDGDGDFTFTRSSSGTRINKAGLIETMGTNVPRLNYRLDADGNPSSCPELLLEPQRTNKLGYSEDFTNWSDSGVTVTANDIVAPNGTKTADKLASSANNWRKSSFFTASSGVTYTVSIYAKLDTSTSTTKTRLEVYNGAGAAFATYDLSNETISNGGFTSVFIERFDDDWYRIGGTYTAVGTNNILYVYPSAGYSISGTMYFWGAQVEAGSFKTSYIPTPTASEVTRNIDSAYRQPFADLNNNYPITVAWKGTVDAISTSQAVFSIFKSFSAVDYLAFYWANAGYIQIERRRSTQDIDSITYPIYIGDVKKVAIKFTSATSYVLYIDGIEIRNESSGTSLSWDFDSVVVGTRRIISDSGLRNSADELFIWNKALTDAEMVEVTSYTSFTEMATQQQYTIQ